MHTQWPPLITAAAQPRWMVWRDRGLTVAMWALFALVCHNFLFFAADEVRVAVGQPPRREWDPLGQVDRLRPFLVVALTMVTFLLAAGVMSVRRMRRNLARPKPPPLAVAEEAAHQEATAEALAAWRDLRVAVVHLDAEGRMHAEPHTPEPEGARATDDARAVAD
jgi:poly-beta-1,6-N-acetyl-D-glucosamine biosynthesis protein PgaD